MAAQDPIFIDQFGTGPAAPPPESSFGPWWKEGWQGRMELWKAFWICFVFGHGIVGGLGFGLMIVAMVLGFATNPGSLDGGLVGLLSSGSVLVFGYMVFAVWVGVTVWRCAFNCRERRWGILARVGMVGYAAAICLPGLMWIVGGGE